MDRGVVVKALVNIGVGAGVGVRLLVRMDRTGRAGCSPGSEVDCWSCFIPPYTISSS